MEKVELLSPAGDMEKLKTAIYFGADAVYIGGKSMSLRALAGNFSDEEIISATEFCHKLNKKIYVTVNILSFRTRGLSRLQKASRRNFL